MNHNWEYKRLGEVGAIITGSTPKTSIEEYYNSPDVMFVKPEIFLIQELQIFPVPKPMFLNLHIKNVAVNYLRILF